MPTQSLDKDKQLAEELQKILTPVIQNPQERMGLINEVVGLLKNVEIDFKDPDTVKALHITCGAHLMQKSNPAFKFDPAQLFKQPDPKNEEEPDLKSVMKNLLLNMFKLTPNGRKKKKDEKEKKKKRKAR